MQIHDLMQIISPRWSLHPQSTAVVVVVVTIAVAVMVTAYPPHVPHLTFESWLSIRYHHGERERGEVG